MSDPLPHIPPELFPDILSYLAVIDLLRFRSVCRSWRSLIDSSYFTKLQLSRSHKSGSNILILSKCYERTIKMLDFCSLEKVPDSMLPPIREDLPFETEIVGSCNGLIALCSTKLSSEFIRFLALWNPFRRKLYKLPRPEIRFPDEGFRLASVVYGFGYDPDNDDYKVVQSIHFKSRTSAPNFSEGMVFSLKTNAWKQVNCPFFFGYTNDSEALINNAFHWIDLVEEEIFAFDLVKEEFYNVPLPQRSDVDSHLGVLGGSLSLATYLSRDRRFDVWVMKEYGVKESWSKLFSLSLNPPPSRHKYMPSPIPLAYSRDGGRVLLNYYCHLSWYDLRGKTGEFVMKDGLYLPIFGPKMCVGSLVVPRRGRYHKKKRGSCGKP